MGIMDKILAKRNLTEDNLLKERESNFDWPEMEEVAKEVIECLILGGEDSVAGVLYDVDADGLFAGYIMEDYLTRKGIKVKRYMNSGKAHGLQESNLDEYEKDGLDWLFIVDAGSGDVVNINKLADKGMKVVVLDHHLYHNDVELSYGSAWILNVVDKPELPKLSGCGVVYRFIELIADMFGDLVGQYEKFVGITVLSDACDMSVPENRYYVQRAYEEYRGNVFLRQFQFYGSWKSFYTYSVIPYLNACIRVGEERQVMELINNMNNRGKMNKVPRDVNRVKTKQAKLVDELMEESKVIKRDGITYLLRRTKPELRPVGGLAANKLMGEYGQPVLVLYRNGDVWEGSFRSNSYTKKVLEGYGFIAKGHARACGISVENKVLQDFVKKFKMEIKDDLNKPEFKISIKKVPEKIWFELAKFNEFSGTNMNRVTVQLTEGYRQKDYEEQQGLKKKSLGFGKEEVVDFTGSEDNKIVVEPVLKDLKYQLIRV